VGDAHGPGGLRWRQPRCCHDGCSRSSRRAAEPPGRRPTAFARRGGAEGARSRSRATLRLGARDGFGARAGSALRQRGRGGRVGRDGGGRDAHQALEAHRPRRARHEPRRPRAGRAEQGPDPLRPTAGRERAQRVCYRDLASPLDPSADHRASHHDHRGAPACWQALGRDPRAARSRRVGRLRSGGLGPRAESCRSGIEGRAASRPRGPETSQGSGAPRHPDDNDACALGPAPRGEPGRLAPRAPPGRCPPFDPEGRQTVAPDPSAPQRAPSRHPERAPGRLMLAALLDRRRHSHPQAALSFRAGCVCLWASPSEGPLPFLRPNVVRVAWSAP
jgi:hypothetical protein